MPLSLICTPWAPSKGLSPVRLKLGPCSTVHLWVWCIATAREGSALLHLWHYPAESCPEHVFISPCLFWEAPDLAGKTQVGGGGNESHAVQHRWAAPTHAATRPLCPKTQRASSKWLQTATRSHPITCEEALRFAQFWNGTPEIKSQGFLKDWQKHLMKEAFIVILTTGAQYNAWHLPQPAKTQFAKGKCGGV